MILRDDDSDDGDDVDGDDVRDSFCPPSEKHHPQKIMCYIPVLALESYLHQPHPQSCHEGPSDHHLEF